MSQPSPAEVLKKGQGEKVRPRKGTDAAENVSLFVHSGKWEALRRFGRSRTKKEIGGEKLKKHLIGDSTLGKRALANSETSLQH